MKKLITILSMALMAISSYAHFGSKGPYGGHVSCSYNWKDSLLMIGTAEGGVYFSTNPNIVGWSAKVVGLKSGKITAVTHTGSYAFAATADSGIFRFDGFVGSDRYWNKANNGLTNLNITCLLAVDSITLFAGTDGGGVFKTTDKGMNWVAVNNADLHHLDIFNLVKVGNRIVSLSVDGGAWYTDDMGASWQDFNDANTLHIDGSTAINYNGVTDELLLLNETGLYKATSASTTNSIAYSLVTSGLPATIRIYDISNDGTNWYLASDSGIYSSPTNAILWTNISGAFTKDAFTTINPFRTLLVAGTANEGIAKTTKSPIKWSWVNTGFNNLKTTAFFSQGRLIVAGTEKGLFVSKDLATNYARGNKGLTDSLHVTDITLAGKYLFATTQNAGVFMTDTASINWTAVNTGLPTNYLTKIIYINNLLFVFDNEGRIFTSPLSSVSWAAFQNGLNTYTNRVALSSIIADGNAYYLSTLGNGVYKRGFADNSWTDINNSLSNLQVTSLAIYGSELFAGTDGSSVLKTSLSSISWAPVDTIVRINHTNTMGLSSETIQALYVGNGYLWASYRGGLLASPNGGKSWIQGGNQFNLPSYANVNKIAFGYSTTLLANGRVFVYTPNNGLYSNALSELPAILTASVEENIIDGAVFGLYPNPSENQFSFAGEKAFEITKVEIYDLQGKSVYTSSNSSIYIHNLSSGIYFVKVSTEKEVGFVKLVVK